MSKAKKLIETLNSLDESMKVGSKVKIKKDMTWKDSGDTFTVKAGESGVIKELDGKEAMVKFGNIATFPIKVNVDNLEKS